MKTWKRWTEAPLVALALLFLGAYAWPILDPSLGSEWRSVCEVATWLAWGAFAVDYIARFALAPCKWAFLRRHAIDLAVVVLPLLRPLRLLRLVTLVRVFNRSAFPRRGAA